MIVVKVEDLKARRREYTRRYRLRHPDRVRATTKKWRLANPEKVAGYASNRDNSKRVAWHRHRNTGWAAEEYDAALVAQKGACACCGKVPKNKETLNADHCHRTKKKGALLCVRCNVAIGILEHDSRPLWDAYIKRFR